MGTLAANSEYANAVNIAAIAPIKNDISIPGPVENQVVSYNMIVTGLSIREGGNGTFFFGSQPAYLVEPYYHMQHVGPVLLCSSSVHTVKYCTVAIK